jgi:c-di-GMP-binding flagellar brake protein YcgR
MQMKVGSTLILEHRNNQNEINRYRCKLAEIRDHMLLIDYPIDEKTGRTSLLLNGTNFMAVYLMDDHVFRFPTTLLHRSAGKVPLLAMSFSGEDQMQSIQRRNYVRVACNVDIAIHSTEGMFRPFTSLTSDLGGGGALVLLPDKCEGVHEDMMIRSWLSLPRASGSYYYLVIRAQVTRIFTDKRTNGQRASIQFLPDSEKERQPIIRYCFEKQLEARKKQIDLEMRRS